MKRIAGSPELEPPDSLASEPPLPCGPAQAEAYRDYKARRLVNLRRLAVGAAAATWTSPLILLFRTESTEEFAWQSGVLANLSEPNYLPILAVHTASGILLVFLALLALRRSFKSGRFAERLLTVALICVWGGVIAAIALLDSRGLARPTLGSLWAYLWGGLFVTVILLLASQFDGRRVAAMGALLIATHCGTLWLLLENFPEEAFDVSGFLEQAELEEPPSDEHLRLPGESRRRVLSSLEDAYHREIARNFSGSAQDFARYVAASVWTLSIFWGFGILLCSRLDNCMRRDFAFEQLVLTAQNANAALSRPSWQYQPPGD